jgi:cytoskeleton protein RodZ
MGSVANVSEETTAPPSDTSAVANTTAPAVPVAVPEAVKTTSPATPAPVAASAAATPEVLAIRARGDTWVEVSGGGKLLLQRVVKAGESVALTDAPPLAVVIGRVDATEILVRGQAFDLGAVARNNVARFEVK